MLSCEDIMFSHEISSGTCISLVVIYLSIVFYSVNKQASYIHHVVYILNIVK